MDEQLIGHEYMAELQLMAELIADLRSLASSFAGAVRRKIDTDVVMLEAKLLKLTETRAFIRCDMPWWTEWRLRSTAA